MINELYEKELRNTSINGVSLADYVKENYILKSVFEDIRIDLMSEYNNNADNWNYCAGIHKAIELIDNRISGKENN